MVLYAVFAVLSQAEAASAYYSRRLGRFLSRDPVGEPGAKLLRKADRATAFIPRDRREGLQEYIYVENAPLNYIDPYLAVVKNSVRDLIANSSGLVSRFALGEVPYPKPRLHRCRSSFNPSGNRSPNCA
jgi:RHS repeat-associated protein